jgi:hypothetical protein
MQILRCLLRLGDVPSIVILFSKIVDAQIVRVLMYGEWGFQTFGDIEKVHLFACKRLLRVCLVHYVTGKNPGPFMLKAISCAYSINCSEF